VREQEKRINIGDRVRFFAHKNKQILLVDVSNCTAREVEEIVRSVPDFVIVLPRSSVLILTDFAGASFDHDTTMPSAQLKKLLCSISHLLRSRP